MREVGYDPTTAKNPSNLTDSKGFAMLMEAAGLGDANLAAAHSELLNQEKLEYLTFPRQMDDEEIYGRMEAVGVNVTAIQAGDKCKMAFYWAVDASARRAALDMAYKLRNRYGGGEGGAQVAVILNISPEAARKYDVS